MTTKKNTTWLDRWPLSWRAAVLMLACSRAWRPFALTILIVAVGGAFATRQNVSAANVLAFYGPPLLAITVFAGLRDHLSRVAVWTGLFQRPVVEVHELMRVFSLRAAIYMLGAAILLAGALSGLMISEAVPPGTLGYTMLTALLWTVVVLFATAAVSTLVAQGMAAAVIAWLIAPVVVAMLAHAMDGSALLQHAVEFVLPPFDAVFGYEAVLRGERPADAVRYTAQLLTFPLLCTAIIGWRFRVWARADLVGSA